MNLTDREWNELAENVHLGGYEYYIHKLNQSIIEVPSEELLSLDDTIDLEEQRDNYEEKHEMFERIIPINNETAYELMENFVDQLPENIHKDKLEDCLKGRYAFRYFKELVNSDLEIKKEWQVFRKENEINWIKAQLNKIFEPEEDLL